MKKVVFLTALFTWLCAPSALAHSLHVFAQYDGHTVSGKAYYSDMTPAAETYMEILQAGQDSPLLEGKTDRDGQFAYPINTTAIKKAGNTAQPRNRPAMPFKMRCTLPMPTGT